jgi:hypothetical protein
MRRFLGLFAAALLIQCLARGDTAHKNGIQMEDPTIAGTTIKWEKWKTVDVRIQAESESEGEANPVLKPGGKDRPQDTRKHGGSDKAGQTNKLGGLTMDEDTKKDDGPTKNVQSGARVSPGDGLQGFDGLLNSMVGPDSTVKSLSVKGPDGNDVKLDTMKANGLQLTEADLRAVAMGLAQIPMRNGSVLGKPQRAQGG